ncbi:suppressor of fused domain protein [Aquimarina sediminis]|uniref:suppressor of fused domain protein n=1 Tax=Aquimarina sediminis TaxID=2070536 RepID=UPI000CA087A6|nr:suppressor of fused domain protein [Aquimarina sediminis]
MNYEEHFKLSCDRRDEFWRSIGEPYPDVISNMINPSFMGGPKWPSLRQAHIGVKTDNATIVASDGLSDPYDDYDSNEENKSYNGLGLELYVVSQNKFEDIPSIINSWEFNLLKQVSNTSASNPNLINMLNEYSYISTTVNGSKLPEGFVDDNGSSGVLLGLESKSIPKKLELSIEKIALINVVLLKPKELEYIIENGAKGRIEIAEKLTTLENGNVLLEDRPSVI